MLQIRYGGKIIYECYRFVMVVGLRFVFISSYSNSGTDSFL
jgi:hypothetical protein